MLLVRRDLVWPNDAPDETSNSSDNSADKGADWAGGGSGRCT
jgi:hypothetical protein